MTESNPLLAHAAVPLFREIAPAHFLPALDVRMDEARRRIAAITKNGKAPDFANTVAALEMALADIANLRNMLDYLMLGAADDALRDVNDAFAKTQDAFIKSVRQDAGLIARFRSVYDAGFDDRPEQDRVLIKRMHLSFLSDGAFLDEAAKERLAAIDSSLIDLSGRFRKNLTAAHEQQAVLFTDPADMDGLDEQTIAAFRDAAQAQGHAQGWLVVPERLAVDGMLEVAHSRHFRREILAAVDRMGRVAPYDNEPVIRDMLALRQERAQLLGFENFAAFALDATMAGGLEAVEARIRDFAAPAFEAFDADFKQVQAFAAREGGPATLEPWDTPYWAARYRQAAYDYDAAAYAAHMPLEDVLGGFFRHAERLFGVQFVRDDKVQVHHDNVRAYGVYGAGNTFTGMLYLDPYARPGSKEGGAWMTNLQVGGPGRANCVSMDMNFRKPEEGGAVLLSAEDVETVFHEGGHALHGLLGVETSYPSLRGTGFASDFYEIHAMVQERWTHMAPCVRDFARHHETRAAMPPALFAARMRGLPFFASHPSLRLMQNALRDLELHKTQAADYVDTDTLHARTAFKHAHAAQLRPYPLTRFGHLFSDPIGGYASTYYGYFWSGVHAADAATMFAQDPYDKRAAKALKRFYGHGAAMDMNAAYIELAGRPAGNDAMLAEMGRAPKGGTVPAAKPMRFAL